MRGVFLDLASIDTGDLKLEGLREALPDWAWYDTTRPGQVAERIAGADVVVSNKVVLDRTLIAEAPALRLIAVAATGTNNIDVAAASEFGVTVSNVRAYATPAVVQHTFALMLALATRLPQYTAAVEAGEWARSEQFCLLDYPIFELAGRSLGIVGYGELGQAVARAARAFGMEVLVAARPGQRPGPGRIALDALLPQVDVLSLHCPLTEQTRGLIDARALALLPDHALLINTARGGIVDESALAAALCAGHIGGAGVDVLSEEPPRGGNPLLEAGIPNLILTPHTAWASRESRQRMLDEVAYNIRAFVDGEPRNRVA